jgi:hypothetical protein
MVLVAFFVCMFIGTILNILLKMTKKVKGLLTFHISLCVSIFVQILNVM